MTDRPRVALVVDPRFSGGTSAAVASEVLALSGRVALSVFAVETAMFKGQRANGALQRALDTAGIEVIWNAPVIRADTIVFHNPSCLRFDTQFTTRMSCQSAFVVTHENFLRPSGSEGFDVAACLNLIASSLVCRNRALVPVSAHNRRGVEAWLARSRRDWVVADFDWLSIFDLDLVPPTDAPRDRRGRHSRQGFEKFPPLATMLAHFPTHAETCTILGGDNYLLDPDTLPKHWKVFRFGEVDVVRFIESFDFFVYFTHPQWRESFGRVIPEAIAAGKLVITDPGTAEAFGDAVVSSDGSDVDDIIRRYVSDPGRFREFVLAAQASLDRFRPEAFRRHLSSCIARTEASRNVLL